MTLQSRARIPTSRNGTDSGNHLGDQSCLILLLQDSALRPLSMSSGGSSMAQSPPSVWGWLQGEDVGMPNALLQGAGLAVGSSREGFESRRHAMSLASSEAGSLQDTCPARRCA